MSILHIVDEQYPFPWALALGSLLIQETFMEYLSCVRLCGELSSRAEYHITLRTAKREGYLYISIIYK